ncbi:MAG: bifunctional phosphopantothenoylcysteine decarboxylase/phosphopantothenate--cysteine ligase CoaBC [Deltaproteobacteria bacterium]|jgi:phosphopantothenoylcysteine decarboxylase/phosphopantothenate--cysteine ligase|nr:bifunctional phosphopantothenoylcysteine decarboxylase/phosphopantothenate--cysteine ligase CoaBC [Deltaproteobacteria bacterium]
MNSMLADKKILFGVSGSIAVYKAAEWVRELAKAGADVTVVMTEAATRFVSPLTFATLSGRRVYTGMFEPDSGEEVTHINLAKKCDLFLVAPATAQTIAKLANGFADNLLTSLALANRAKMLIFPAMNSNMYCHGATRANLARLKDYGYGIIEPDEGKLACGDEGVGRLVDWETARDALLSAFAPQDLLEKTVIITAGPTCEPFDPARHLSNRSSGKMGFALARSAKQRGARVILISGPTSLKKPSGVEVINSATALEMHDAVMDNYDRADIVVMSAAVSDYRPAKLKEKKVKKGSGSIALELVPNPDILKELGKRKGKAGSPLLVGFAAESSDHLEEGKRKLKEKKLDLIVVNDIIGTETGFASDTNQVSLIDRDYQLEKSPLLTKEECAYLIWDKIARLMQ